MSFTSPAHQESSDDEGHKIGNEQFNEDDSLSEKRGRTIVVKEIQTTSPSDIGKPVCFSCLVIILYRIDVISWHSEFATNEDLSGSKGIANAVEIPVDWTQEPNPSSSEEDSWGDFTPVRFSGDKNR